MKRRLIVISSICTFVVLAIICMVIFIGAKEKKVNVNEIGINEGQENETYENGTYENGTHFNETYANEINLNKYVVIMYEGVNGYATARFEIDFERLLSTNGELISNVDLKDIEDAIHGGLNKSDYLKNGDVIRFTWDVSAKNIEVENDVKFVYSDIEIKLDDLEELKEVDAFAGVEMSFDGPSGFATAKFNTENQEYYQFKYVISAEKNLKNGDSVTVSLVDDYMEYCVYAGIIPKETEKSYKVEGLEELKKFDAFYGLRVSFSKYDAMGNAIINDAAVKYDELSFYCEEDGKLSNGDVVSIKLDEFSVQKCIDRYGVIPEEMTKEYTVSGLERLIEEFSDLASPEWESQYKQWEWFLWDYVPSEWVYPESLLSIEHIGTSISKPTEDSWVRDKIYTTMFYKLKVLQPKGHLVYYYFVELENMKKTADGTMGYENIVIPGGMLYEFRAEDGLYYRGYKTFDEMYEDRVIGDRNAYNTECHFDEGYEYTFE